MNSAIISTADASRIAIPTEDEDVAALGRNVIAKLTYAVGRDPIVATDRDWFVATALCVRDHVIEPSRNSRQWRVLANSHILGVGSCRAKRGDQQLAEQIVADGKPRRPFGKLLDPTRAISAQR